MIIPLIALILGGKDRCKRFVTLNPGGNEHLRCWPASFHAFFGSDVLSLIKANSNGNFVLANVNFVMQSIGMETDRVSEHLQVIRTLMERSAVYRRALAPITLYVGFVGMLAAVAGLVLHLNSPRDFGGLWLGAAVVAVVGAFFIARRQALKDHEPFWSPPARRVTQALLPPLTAGMCLSLLILLVGASNEFEQQMPFFWALFYGCALHSAGFFMPRGVKWFGWIYIVLTLGIMIFVPTILPNKHINGNWLMGFFFGVLHLAYGAYLYLTEKGNSVV